LARFEPVTEIKDPGLTSPLDRKLAAFRTLVKATKGAAPEIDPVIDAWPDTGVVLKTPTA
jgi:hypothetical protein